MIQPGKSGNVLATIAIGDAYLEPFMKYAFHTWEMYCKRHDLGLILFDDHLVDQAHPDWKNPYWQKFLIGEALNNAAVKVNNVCCLDTDILISPLAPDIFSGRNEAKVGLISKRKNLPLDHHQLLRRMAFLRNRFYDKAYPLDSSLFISLVDYYAEVGLDVEPDDACSGVFVYNCLTHGPLLAEYYRSFGQEIMAQDGGGEQRFLNHFVQSQNLVEWLDYKFQALWTYEIASKYPFLYGEHRNNLSLMKSCIEASLFTNYFLHFAGSWHEGKMWEQVRVFDTSESLSMFGDFADYLKVPVFGKPLGQIKPKDL